MKAIVLKINKKKPEKEKLKQAVHALCDGGVIVIPTDTVYGLAASAFNISAQRAIYRLKGRSYRKPLVVMAGNIKSIEPLVEISRDAQRLMKKFWPGPLTIILPTTPLGRILMGGRHDCGIRIPDDDAVLHLIRAFTYPIATTSANPSGKPSAKTGDDALKYFGSKVHMIIDCGKSHIGKESTVIDMIKFPYVVVREGALPKKKIHEHLTRSKR